MASYNWCRYRALLIGLHDHEIRTGNHLVGRDAPLRTLSASPVLTHLPQFSGRQPSHEDVLMNVHELVKLTRAELEQN